MDTKQAKDFLVAQVAQQAAIEGVPLADLEKRMMYFTESDPASCPNPIALNDEFEEQFLARRKQRWWYQDQRSRRGIELAHGGSRGKRDI